MHSGRCSDSSVCCNAGDNAPVADLRFWLTPADVAASDPTLFLVQARGEDKASLSSTRDLSTAYEKVAKAVER